MVSASNEKKKLKTRDKIITQSLDLFNQHNASNVSTKRIAKEMAISPGNLYYHFKSKEDIIRELWDIMSGKLQNTWNDPAIHNSEEAIARFLYNLSSVFYEYRFFYLELPLLVANDPVLKKTYAGRTKKSLENLKILTDSWIAVGIMKKPESEQERILLIRNMYLISQLWLSYWKTIFEELRAENIKEGMMQILSLYRPYISKTSSQKIDAAIEAL